MPITCTECGTALASPLEIFGPIDKPQCGNCYFNRKPAERKREQADDSMRLFDEPGL
jgi:predicted  nucleic acid-binding Zn-ribbon protein